MSRRISSSPSPASPATRPVRVYTLRGLLLLVCCLQAQGAARPSFAGGFADPSPAARGTLSNQTPAPALRPDVRARALADDDFSPLPQQPRPVTAASPPPAAAGSQGDAALLRPAAPVRRELRGGEAHFYRFDSEAGYYLRVVTEQQGVDVIVALLGPSGERLAEVDSPNGRWGPESLSFVAADGGVVRVEVRAARKTADAGQYEIALEALRRPTPADLSRVEAEAAFKKAYQELRRSPAEARQAAARKLEQLLPAFRDLGDRDTEVIILNSVGLSYHSQGELQTALDYYGRALSASRTLRHRNFESIVLNNIGGVYDLLGEPQRALDYYGQALPALQSLGSAGPLSDTLNNIGVIHYKLGDLQTALEKYEQALALQRPAGDRRKEAGVLVNIGAAYIALGEERQALLSLQQALETQRGLKDTRGEAETLHYMGFAHAALGDFDKAFAHYRQSLPLRRAAGDRFGEALTLDNIGDVYGSLGERGKALESHRQALQMRRALKDRRGEAISLGNIGRSHVSAGEPRESLRPLQDALALFRSLEDARGEAWVTLELARAERDIGRLTEARRLMEGNLDRVEQLRSTVTSLEWRATYFGAFRRYYDFYIDLLMRLDKGDPAGGLASLAFQVSERARARSLLELLAEARVDIRRGANQALLRRERDLSQLLSGKAERLMWLAGQPDAHKQAAALRREVGRLQAEYQHVQAEIRTSSPHYASLTQPQPLGLKEVQERVLDPDTLLLAYSLGEERSYLWAVTRSSINSYELAGRARIEEAARQLYGLLNARGVSGGGETARQRQLRIGQADSQLPGAARRLSEMVLGAAASELGRKRLAIVADGALQYIPFGMLPRPSDAGRPPARGGQGAAGASGGRHAGAAYRPLIEDHEIVNLPSASTLAAQRVRFAARRPAPNLLAVVADPVFSNADSRVRARGSEAVARKPEPRGSAETARKLEHLAGASGLAGLWTGGQGIARLPFTRQEAAEILAVAPGGGHFRAFDFEANHTTVTSRRLSGYRYVHFATHGYLDVERPGLSALVLSLVDERGQPRNGFLRANEIYNLHLPAELVTLSACQTGLGKEIKGEGLVGLTRGFMYAGAARVVVSLWNVNDRATSELMSRFYRRVLRGGQRPAEALRSAQLEMLKQRRWQSPYYWSAFVLQGEWQ